MSVIPVAPEVATQENIVLSDLAWAARTMATGLGQVGTVGMFTISKCKEQQQGRAGVRPELSGHLDDFYARMTRLFEHLDAARRELEPWLAERRRTPTMTTDFDNMPWEEDEEDDE